MRPSARLLPLGAGAVMLGAVAAFAIAATWGLTWPPDDDAFRDIGIAQSLLDGRLGDDPAYLGERLWYNPLVPVLLAGVALITGLDLPATYARAGAFVNLAAPLAFWALGWRLLGPWASVAALGAFLVVTPGQDPAWAAATYSPWLWPMIPAQTFVYVGLLGIAVWRDRAPSWRDAALGALLGLAFLAHTAPALILGAVQVVLAIPRLANPRTRGTTATRLAISSGVALLIAAPFLAIVVGHYGYRVQNPVPQNWRYDVLELANLGGWLGAQLRMPMLVSILGLAAIARGRLPWRATMLAWAAATWGMLAYTYVAQAAVGSGVRLPTLVSSFHFLFAAKAAEAMLFGAGVAALVGAARFASGRWRRVAAGLLLAGIGTFSLAAAAAYGERSDYAVHVPMARERMADADLSAAYAWLRANGSPNDVVLAPPLLGHRVVTPAGRKLVETDPYFSNPYVDLGVRRALRVDLDGALQRGDPAFVPMAQALGVRFVLLESPPELSPAALSRLFDGEPCIAPGGLWLARVRSEASPLARRPAAPC